MAIIPFFGHLSPYPNFSKIIHGILCTFVGLLLITTIHFGVEGVWNPFTKAIGQISLSLFLFKVNSTSLIAGVLVLSFFNYACRDAYLFNLSNRKHIKPILFSHLHCRLILHDGSAPKIMIIAMRAYKPAIDIHNDFNITRFILFHSNC